MRVKNKMKLGQAGYKLFNLLIATFRRYLDFRPLNLLLGILTEFLSASQYAVDKLSNIGHGHLPSSVRHLLNFSRTSDQRCTAARCCADLPPQSKTIRASENANAITEAIPNRTLLTSGGNLKIINNWSDANVVAQKITEQNNKAICEIFAIKEYSSRSIAFISKVCRRTRYCRSISLSDILSMVIHRKLISIEIQLSQFRAFVSLQEASVKCFFFPYCLPGLNTRQRFWLDPFYLE